MPNGVPKAEQSASRRQNGKAATLTGKERMDRAREKIAGRIDPLLAKVVADPLRVQIILTAHARQLSAKDFAAEWNIPEHGASYHMRFLHKREFLVIVDEVKRRGATEVFYRATKRAFLSDADWASLNVLVKDGISRAIVEELYITILQAADAGTLDAQEESILWWQEVPLDEITFPKAMAMLRLVMARLVELGDETARNQAEGKGGKSLPGVLGLLGFEGAPEKKPYKKRPRRS